MFYNLLNRCKGKALLRNDNIKYSLFSSRFLTLCYQLFEAKHTIVCNNCIIKSHRKVVHRNIILFNFVTNSNLDLHYCIMQR